MSAAPRPCSTSPSTRAARRCRWRARCRGGRRARRGGRGRGRCGRSRCRRRGRRRGSAPGARSRASTRSASARLVVALRRHRDQRGGEAEQVGGVGRRARRLAVTWRAPWSRRMSLSFDLSWRSPSVRRFTTSTHGRPNSPPGYVAGRVAGDRDAPVGHDAAAQLLAGLGVDHRDRAGEDAPGAEHHAAPHPRARRPRCSASRSWCRRRPSPARPAAARAPRRCRPRPRGAHARRSARTSRPSPRCRPWCRRRRARRCSRSSASSPRRARGRSPTAPTRRAPPARPLRWKSRFSGILSAYSNGPSSIVSICDNRNSSSTAYLSHSCTTTSPADELGDARLAGVEQLDRLEHRGRARRPPA